MQQGLCRLASRCHLFPSSGPWRQSHATCVVFPRKPQFESSPRPDLMDGPLNAGTKTASGCSPTKCVFAVVLRTVCGPEHVTDVHSSRGEDGAAPKANKQGAAPLGPKHGATLEPVAEVPRLGQSELGEGLPRRGGAFVTATESQNAAHLFRRSHSYLGGVCMHRLFNPICVRVWCACVYVRVECASASIQKDTGKRCVHVRRKGEVGTGLALQVLRGVSGGTFS